MYDTFSKEEDKVIFHRIRELILIFDFTCPVRKLRYVVIEIYKRKKPT